MFFELKCAISNLAGKLTNLDSRIVNKCDRYIMAFHRVLPWDMAREEYLQDCMWISPDSFEAIIDWMLRIGAVVDLDRIADFDTISDRPLFALTFDDGWKDNYDFAFPILKKKGLQATVFIVTSAIETGQLFWTEELIRKTNSALANTKEGKVRSIIEFHMGQQLASIRQGNIYGVIDSYLEMLKELSKTCREALISDYYDAIGVDHEPIHDSVMTWEQIREMADNNISFGSHTHTHAILQYCDEERTLEELRTSKKVLEARLSRSVVMFCYPNARYKQLDAQLMKQAGYKYAFRIHNLAVTKKDLPYFVPRFLTNESLCKNMNYFKLRLLGIPLY
jgi:peptidoglycan/xylan/chitin deacetylase (PgdA/CDA1 family)